MAATLQAAVASQVETTGRTIVYRRGAARDRGDESRRWLAERVVARKARSNDVCLALKERVRVRGGRYGFWHENDG